MARERQPARHGLVARAEVEDWQLVVESPRRDKGTQRHVFGLLARRWLQYCKVYADGTKTSYRDIGCVLAQSDPEGAQTAANSP